MKKVIVFLLVALLLSSTSTIFAASNENLTSEVSKIKTELLNNGVPESVANSLLDKFLKGETWDSFKEEYKDLKPQVVKPGYEKTIYPDGSIIVTTYSDIPCETDTTLHDNQISPTSIVQKKWDISKKKWNTC